MSEEPTRLRLDPEADAELRATLEAARGDHHDDARIDRLAMRLGPLLTPPGGGGGGGGGAGPAMKAATAKGASTFATVAKGLGLAAAIGAAGTILVLERTPSTPGIDATTSSATTVESSAVTESATARGAAESETGFEAESELEAQPETQPETSEPETTESSRRMRVRSSSEPPVADEPIAPPVTQEAVVEVVEPPAPTEAAIIASAMRSLRSDPAAALAQTELHARHHPSGAMSEDREVIAIDALVRLGRRADADARATRFREAHPGSPSNRRIERILANGP